MLKLTFLGTGSAMVTKEYNTCFILSQDNYKLLVDCGGGHEILRQFKDNNLSIGEIDTIFITHSHADHILGFPFIFREMIWSQKRITIICSLQVKTDLEFLIRMDIPDQVEKNKHLLDFHIIDQHSSYKNLHFLKVDDRQHGFVLQDKEKKITFLGDAPLRGYMLRDCDIVICEAFCSKDDNVKITGKHQTIEEVLKLGEEKDIKKLIITHTFTDLRRFSSGKIIIPRKGDTIIV